MNDATTTYKKASKQTHFPSFDLITENRRQPSNCQLSNFSLMLRRMPSKLRQRRKALVKLVHINRVRTNENIPKTCRAK